MSNYNEVENKLRFDLFFHISRSIHNRIDSDIIRSIDSRITNKVHGFTRQFQNHMREHMKITRGQFLSNGRVSNFWHWKEVLKNGELGEEECGYGW